MYTYEHMILNLACPVTWFERLHCPVLVSGQALQSHCSWLQIVTGAQSAEATDSVPGIGSNEVDTAASSAFQFLSHALQVEAAKTGALHLLFPVPKRSFPVASIPNGPSLDDTVQIGAVQQSVQGAAAEAVNAAGVALRSAQEVEQSFESMLSGTTSRVPTYTDVQYALGDALRAELGPDATNVFLGLGGAIILLLGVVAFQIAQRRKSETVGSHV